MPLLLVLGGSIFPLHGHGDLDVEIAALTREIDAEPTAERFLKRGELRREHGEFEAAMEDYTEATALDSKLDLVLYCRGRALFESGKPEQARQSLDRFLERKAASSEGYLTRARVLAALKDYKAAAEDYTRSIGCTKDPRPDHFLERAEVLVNAGELDSAVRGLDEGMASLGAVPTLQSATIGIEVQLARFDAALARIDRLVAAAERKESWLILRAEVLAKAGRPDDARRSYQDALSAIEALPPRLRTLPATVELETKARTGVTAR
ncbi:tetratricopeptide repeat protein [Luteolibacter sp. LG18]|uniref:tetratricopeptide repeat protein n=1 Tax=Luteolibacter sp. LG18 TaxID=2819286 RepID=UPI0030C65AF4